MVGAQLQIIDKGTGVFGSFVANTKNIIRGTVADIIEWYAAADGADSPNIHVSGEAATTAKNVSNAVVQIIKALEKL